MNRKTITDMTVGSPARHIIKFTLPLLLGNLFQQLYNMVDSIVVGKFVSEDALAAVGACGSTNFLLFSLNAEMQARQGARGFPDGSLLIVNERRETQVQRSIA